MFREVSWAEGDLASLFSRDSVDVLEDECGIELGGSEVEYLLERVQTKVTLMAGSCHHSLWGNLLWNSSIEATNALQKMDSLKNKSVVELGAGLGLPSIASAILGARKVVATDFPEKNLLDTLKSNVDRNILWNKPERIVVDGLLWGNSSDISKVKAHNINERFDVVIISDLIFNHVCHHALAFTIMELLDAHGVCICTYGHHVPRRMNDDLNFFNILPLYNLSAKKAIEIEHDISSEEDRRREETSIVYVREIAFAAHSVSILNVPAKHYVCDVAIIGSSLLHTLVAYFLSKSHVKTLLIEEGLDYGSHDSTVLLKNIYQRCLEANGSFTIHKNFSDLFDGRLRLDIDPKILRLEQCLLDFLSEANIHEYVAFDAVESLWTLEEREHCALPLGKTEIFKSVSMKLQDKREIMRLLQKIQSIPEGLEGLKENTNLLEKLLSNLPDSLKQRLMAFCDNAHARTRSSSESLLRFLFSSALSANLGHKTPFFVPSFGNMDLVEGVVRAASMQGAATMRGQPFKKAELSSHKANPHRLWLGECCVEAKVVLRYLDDERQCHSSIFVAVSDGEADDGSSTNSHEEYPRHVVILPNSTPFNSCHIHILIKRDEITRNWVYYFKSFEKPLVVSQVGNLWISNFLKPADVLFTCSWNTKLSDDVKISTKNSENVVLSEGNCSFYYTGDIVRHARSIAQDIIQRL